MFNLSEKSQKVDGFDGPLHEHPHNDTYHYYKRHADDSLSDPIGHSDYKALSQAEQQKYEGVREKINHPNISGPFYTGWAATDFDNALPVNLGLPNLPGQITQLANPK